MVRLKFNHSSLILHTNNPTIEVKESVVEFDSDDDDQPPHKVQKTTTNTTVKNAQHEVQTLPRDLRSFAGIY